ncbi:MAG: hypothetical protein HUJ53_10715 [Holdemanella sp.]|nr:hypothetical protein [Holdemanella sp.]
MPDSQGERIKPMSDIAQMLKDSYPVLVDAYQEGFDASVSEGEDLYLCLHFFRTIRDVLEYAPGRMKDDGIGSQLSTEAGFIALMDNLFCMRGLDMTELQHWIMSDDMDVREYERKSLIGFFDEQIGRDEISRDMEL